MTLTPVFTVEEAASRVKKAAEFVAEQEERHSYLVKTTASCFDEVQKARRTLREAEARLLVSVKNASSNVAGLNSSGLAAQKVSSNHA